MPVDHSSSSPAPTAVAAPRASRRRWPRVPGWLLWIIVPTALHILYSWDVGAFSRDMAAQRNVTMAGMVAETLESYIAAYPGPFPAGSDGAAADADTDTSAQADLVTALTGGGMEGARDFLEDFPRARVDGNDSAALGWGLRETPGARAIHEARGGCFRVRMDLRNEGGVENPNPVQRADGVPRIPRAAAVWTAGKDGNWDTWEDNETSWGHLKRAGK